MKAQTSDRKIAELPNLGPKSAEMMAAIGITHESQLRALGSVAAFLRVREAGAKPSLLLLYAIEGALTGQKWNELPLEVRATLDRKVNFNPNL